jgi:hypothetical protein
MTSTAALPAAPAAGQVAVHRDPSALGPWAGFGVFALYAAAAVLAGLFLASHRDA